MDGVGNPPQRNRRGDVYEPTGPAVLDIDGLAEAYTRALGRPVSGVDLPFDDFATLMGSVPGVLSHTVAVRLFPGP